MIRLLFLFALHLCLLSLPLYAQPCSNLSIQHKADIASTPLQMTLTMLPDAGGRPYLYVANKEGGLKIYDISNPSSPQFVRGIEGNAFQSLHVMNLSQQGNYLYLALGNHFGATSQTPGMAIVDVSNPATASVKSVWKDSSTTEGCGIVQVEDNYAYIGVMGRGLVIADVSDKANVRFVSRFVPDITYPTPNPTPSLYNARGMEVKNSVVYLCYDAGGLRIINCTDKKNPVEIGRYSNPILNGKPRAYNNIVLDDSLAYIAVDYCGLEVLNVRNPASIKLHSWWNPWSCHTNPNPLDQWLNSPGHCNEIVYNKECHKLFISTGRSDMYVVDVSNPAQPDSCAIYGGVDNGIGTWGISTKGSNIFLSYITTLGVPFPSNWTGVKILSYTPCTTSSTEEKKEEEDFFLSPHPTDDILRLHCTAEFNPSIRIRLITVLGGSIETTYTKADAHTLLLNTSALGRGMYIVCVEQGGKTRTQTFIKQ